MYLKDGIHALNTAFVHGGVFIHVKKERSRSIRYIFIVLPMHALQIFFRSRAASFTSVKTHRCNWWRTMPQSEVQKVLPTRLLRSLVEKDAMVEYYKIQNDGAHINQVSTTVFRQTGKSNIHAVTISLNGGIVRNNLNIALEAEHSEAHLYGLYFLKGDSHVDNHTVVDHVKPNCMSNELYKGIVDDNGNGDLQWKNICAAARAKDECIPVKQKRVAFRACFR